MDNALTLAHVMGPIYVVFGLSLLLYVNSWKHLFEKWESDHYGLFGMMFFEAVLGLVAVNMYNAWEWNVWLLVTLTGWGLLLESAYFFLMPGSMVKKCLAWKKSANCLYFCGVVSLAVGGVLSYYSYFI